MARTHSETGRSLVETLAVLAVMAILLFAGLLAYEGLMKYWRKTTTVKEISDVNVRYGVHPVMCSDSSKVKGDECDIDMKTVAPDMMRLDQYSVQTADGGNISIKRSIKSTAYMVVAAYIEPSSCEELLENGAYDAVLLDCKYAGDLEIQPGCNTAKGEQLALGRDYVQKLLKEEKRTKLIDAFCAKEGGKVTTARLINKGGCSTSTHGYYYSGKCYHCPKGQVEDILGHCCEGKNDCGYCPGYCSRERGNGCTGGKPASDLTICHEGQCVECVDSSDCNNCKNGNVLAASCSNNHCCPIGQTWNGTKCVCPGNGDYCDGICCKSTQHCTVRGGVGACCNNTGVLNSPCDIDECCNDGLTCTSKHCCSANTFWHDKASRCAECIKNYDGTTGTGACPDTNRPICDNKGPDATWTCVECPSGFWNPETKTCTECLADYGSGETGACENIDNPICDKAKGWTCQPCPKAGEVWTEVAPGVWQCKKTETVCNSEHDSEECCKKAYPTGYTYMDSHCCPTGEFWGNTAKRCVKCLVNHGKGTGECPTTDKPICDNKGSDATWTCQKCYGEFTWWENKCQCADGKTWVKKEGSTAEDGTAGEGLCCPHSNDVVYVDQKQCCADDGSNNEFCCKTINGAGYEWKEVSPGVWQCKKTKAECNSEHDSAECCKQAHPNEDYTYADSHCCPTTKFWNATANMCTSCLHNYDGLFVQKGVCKDKNKPICDKTKDWTCQPCPNEGEVWTQTSFGKWECVAECANGEHSSLECCLKAHPTGYTYADRHCCPTNEFWSSTANRCVKCLVDYGRGRGACSATQKPICDNEGTDATWECKECPGAFRWWKNKCQCPDDKKWVKKEGSTAEDGTTGEGLCCPHSDDVVYVDQKVCCEKGTPRYTTAGCCAADGSNSAECCTAVMGDGYEWVQVSGVWQCVSACTDEHTSEACCRKAHPEGGYEYANSHCCPTGEFWSSTANRCVECLVDYGSGNGQCKMTQKPLCDNQGANATWSCKACPGVFVWKTDKCDCPGDNEWVASDETQPVGTPGAGACCPSKSAYVVDKGMCCPIDRPTYYSGAPSVTDGCCAKDGSNSEFCCTAVMGDGYEWRKVSDVWKCLPKCTDASVSAECCTAAKRVWHKITETTGECCASGEDVYNGICCSSSACVVGGVCGILPRCQRGMPRGTVCLSPSYESLVSTLDGECVGNSDHPEYYAVVKYGCERLGGHLATYDEARGSCCSSFLSETVMTGAQKNKDPAEIYRLNLQSCEGGYSTINPGELGEKWKPSLHGLCVMDGRTSATYTPSKKCCTDGKVYNSVVGECCPQTCSLQSGCGYIKNCERGMASGTICKSPPPRSGITIYSSLKTDMSYYSSVGLYWSAVKSQCEQLGGRLATKEEASSVCCFENLTSTSSGLMTQTIINSNPGWGINSGSAQEIYVSACKGASRHTISAQFDLDTGGLCIMK